MQGQPWPALIGYWLNGLLWGILLTLLLEAYWLYRQLGFSTQPPPPQKSTWPKVKDGREEEEVDLDNPMTSYLPRFKKDWPPEVVDYLEKRVLGSVPGETENFDWLNACLHRFFVECLQSEILRIKVWAISPILGFTPVLLIS
jgi:hypothetical protein